MSLKTFLTRLLRNIMTLFDHLPSQLKEAVKIAVEITEAIKNFDDKEPEVADIVTTLIPGDLDDKIVAWLRIELPVILIALRLVDTNSATSEPAKNIYMAMDTIKHLDSNVKNAFLHDLAALLSQVVAKALNKELKWADAVYIVEWYYQTKFKTA